MIMKKNYIPRPKHQVIRLYDRLSEDAVGVRLNRICNNNAARKAAELEAFGIGSVGPGGLIETEDDLTSLGLPRPVFIPHMPSEGEIRAAMAHTDEVNAIIQRARELAEKEK
jgi:hypothetical protein